MKFVCAVVFMFLPASALLAAESHAVFTKPPTAVGDGAGVKIEFAVDRATDVAVMIEDARGKSVRRLVAGVLGKNPPEPLLAGSLKQSPTYVGVSARYAYIADTVNRRVVRVKLTSAAKTTCDVGRAP